MTSDRPTRPHGTFTPAATIGRVLSQAGYKAFTTRKDTAFSGHRCTWDPSQNVTTVSHRCGDSTHAEALDVERQDMLTEYEQLLRAKGYVVEWIGSGYALRVRPSHLGQEAP